jgi:hypothetical protein
VTEIFGQLSHDLAFAVANYHAVSRRAGIAASATIDVSDNGEVIRRRRLGRK